MRLFNPLTALSGELSKRLPNTLSAQVGLEDRGNETRPLSVRTLPGQEPENNFPGQQDFIEPSQPSQIPMQVEPSIQPGETPAMESGRNERVSRESLGRGTAPAQDRHAGTHHTVRKGETLGGIALEYGASPQEIAEVNNLANPELIFVGQDLVIPREDHAHRVMPGETIDDIADMYNATIGDLMNVNNLPNPQAVREGMTLRIPQYFGDAPG